MKQEIITNKITNNIKNIIEKIGEKSDYVKVAVAFFSDNEIIEKWVINGKRIKIIVSLRPPTNYYTLKSLQSQLKINCHFLDNSFHSKFYLFYKKNNLFSAIIGSSNFTNGGLSKNIETNIVLTDKYLLKQIEKQFDEILEQSYLLQPLDLERYKSFYDKYLERDIQNNNEEKEFLRNIIDNRQKRLKKQRISKEAKQYFVFWRIVDEIKDFVHDISEDEFPNIPIYLTIDHFWHWVKTIWVKENHPTPQIYNRKKEIRKMFKEYCDWDKFGKNYTIKINKVSKNVFSNLLSAKNIDNLTIEQAKEIYRNLNSGGMRAKRFKSDEKFVKENQISQIRTSLKYLIYANDELDLKIHNLCNNNKYKLKEFNSSATQEIIGWVNPLSFPLRNDKADFAVKILGYDINTKN